MSIVEKEWDQIIKFLIRTNMPILPVYISGTNSTLFHAMGLIHPRLRTIKLPSELFNKKNKKIHIKIGHVIKTEDLKKIGSFKEISHYLKLKSNMLGNSIKIDHYYKKPILGRKKRKKEIIQPIDKKKIVAEIQQLPNTSTLTEINEYKLILIQSNNCPNLMLELGRKRELTFRAIGEGTNKEIDLDPFDIYYHHLIIWDTQKNELVGSYRMGKGDEIMEKFGISGFYVSTLFDLNQKLGITFRSSLELGRSFIAEPYQKKPITLLLLWKGISIFMNQNPQFKFLIGPVSISSNYSKLSQSLIVKYSKQYLQDNSLTKYVKPKKKFKHKIFSQNKINNIIFGTGGEIDKLEQLLQETDNGKKLPILLKKYIGLNAKIIAFNIDTNFNNCLDGFLFLNYNEIPENLKEKIKN